MWKDPIVEELHQVRQALAAQHGNDLHAIVKHVQALEAQREKPALSFAPKRPWGWKPPGLLDSAPSL